MQLFHDWKGLRLEIAEYVRDNNISEDEFRFLGIYEWQDVYDRMLAHFVDEQYARKYGLHWVNTSCAVQKNIDKIYSFQLNVDQNCSCEWLERLPEIVLCEKLYLFLEEHRQHSKYWIAECNPAVIYLMINDTYSVNDYYITDKKFNWLITGDHHDIIQFWGEGLDLETIKKVCTKQSI